MTRCGLKSHSVETKSGDAYQVAGQTDRREATIAISCTCRCRPDVALSFREYAYMGEDE